jgi:hypothetical protein
LLRSTRIPCQRLCTLMSVNQYTEHTIRLFQLLPAWHTPCPPSLQHADITAQRFHLNLVHQPPGSHAGLEAQASARLRELASRSALVDSRIAAYLEVQVGGLVCAGAGGWLITVRYALALQVCRMPSHASRRCSSLQLAWRCMSANQSTVMALGAALLAPCTARARPNSTRHVSHHTHSAPFPPRSFPISPCRA